ncbi:MAG: magnesium/cobalt transporter CorA [Anaerolineae bacterium]
MDEPTLKPNATSESPRSLLHTSVTRQPTTAIMLFNYNTAGVHEGSAASADECYAVLSHSSVTWIDVNSLAQPELIKELCDRFGIDPLVQEDILDTEQRPKVEDYGEYISIVLKMLRYDSIGGGVIIEQVSLILGNTYVISFQEGFEGDVFEGVRRRIRSGAGRIRVQGADYLAYALVDAIVDNYFIVLDHYLNAVEKMRAEIVDNRETDLPQRIFALEGEVMAIRHTVWPLIEAFGSLRKDKTHLVKRSTDKYLRDVNDHVLRVIDGTQTAIDMLDRLQDYYLSVVSNRQNEILKVLTIVSTIFIPLTFIAGVYGMNFEHMPELAHQYGYPVALAMMAGIAVGMLIYFKRKGWI